jgi:cysteine synthase A
VVTVFSDSNKKYLSTDLLKDEPAKEGFLEPVIELHGFTAFNRSCEICDVVKRGAAESRVPGARCP